jgi:hypothetical protein
MFCRPLEPFLVDVGSAGAMPGRVERASLARLWEWIRRDALPTEAAAYVEQASAARLANDEAAAERLADAFQTTAVREIAEWLGRARKDERVSRRLAAQVGTPRALDELSTLHRVLVHRAALDEFEAGLPTSIRSLGGEQVDHVLGLLRQTVGEKGEALPLALTIVMVRLATFWQLIRLPIRAAESDVAIRVAQTPLAIAVDLVLAEFGRRIETLRKHIRASDFARGAEVMHDLHDASRALRTEIDLSGETPWSRELGSLRTMVSDFLQAEIENTPGQMRRLLRPRNAREIDGATALDAMDVAEVEGRIELAAACRKYAGELAINQMAPRIYSEVKNYLDHATSGLLEALRTARSTERAYRQSQVDAAVRFGGKLYGAEYAALLLKAASVAGSERPAAKA